MGAGLTKSAMNARIRRHLQKFAHDNGGTYAKYLAQGVKDGLPWRCGMNVVRASNGEAYGFDRIVIGEGDEARAYAFPDLHTAMLAYRMDTAPVGAPIFEGEPGDYKRLIGRRNPWIQTWGFEYAIGFNLDNGGFDIFTKEPGQVLTFRGESADYWARELWAALPAMGAGKDRMKCDRATQVGHANAVDTFCRQFMDAEGWEPSDDWRAKPDHYKGDFNLPMR